MEQKPIKILYQPLKAKWYQMIETGEKPEEYREATAYWLRRLVLDDDFDQPILDEDIKFFLENPAAIENMFDCGWKPLPYTHVQFSLGYPKKDDASRRMTFELKAIEYREGREEWGAEKGRKYLVEILGRRTTLDGTKLWED